MEALKDIKQKSIIIDGDLHHRFKTLCKGKNMKIGGVVEGLIKVYISDPRGTQKLIDDINSVINGK